MNQAEINDLVAAEPRIIRGMEVVCELCCSDGRLETSEDGLVYDCPIHLRVLIRGGRVVAAQTRGFRS